MTEALDQLRAAAESLLRAMPAEEETADYLGELDHVIRRLTDHKRAILSELPRPVRGSAYSVNETRKGVRSYNTAAIISRFAAQGVSLNELVRNDVARISWQWTNLQRAAQDADVDMHLTHREIEDNGEVDGPMVGEVWKRSYEVKPL